MLELLAQQGSNWPQMVGDVETFIANCPTCQKVWLGQVSLQAALKTTVIYKPWDVLAINTIGPLPVDSMGNKYIIVWQPARADGHWRPKAKV